MTLQAAKFILVRDRLDDVRPRPEWISRRAFRKLFGLSRRA